MKATLQADGRGAGVLLPGANIVALLLYAGFLGLGVNAQGPTNQARVTKSDFSYLGAFALPQDQVGGSYFTWGGGALAPYRDPATGRDTLFMRGHAWYPEQVAQTVGTIVPTHLILCGLLPFNGRLIVAAAEC